MINYTTLRAIHDQRVERLADEYGRAARPRSRSRSVRGEGEWLDALAQGLAGVGMPRRDSRPRPAL
jgi:hypothetical protein